MGYLHIDNLYKNSTIRLFRECYALEKIHGTSAHVGYTAADDTLHLFSGEQKEAFALLFDAAALKAFLTSLGGDVFIYGEAYGGKIQKQSHRYGAAMRFTAFDVKRNERWLCVPEAEGIVKGAGLEFVHYSRINTDVEALNAARDAFSVQATRNGVEAPMTMEGVVLRPLQELCDSRGGRIIAKHKRDDFRETFQPRRIDDTPQVLEDAKAIAIEWVTPMRLAHVLQKLPEDAGIEATPLVISAMLEDVLREATGEIVESKAARRAICQRAAMLFKDSLRLLA